MNESIKKSTKGWMSENMNEMINELINELLLEKDGYEQNE